MRRPILAITLSSTILICAAPLSRAADDGNDIDAQKPQQPAAKKDAPPAAPTPPAKPDIDKMIAAARNAMTGDPTQPKAFLETDAATRKRLTAMLDEAKKEAREKIRNGVERALAKRPAISPEMAALLRSSSTHETWLKIIVEGAFRKNSFLDLESMYKSSCMAISRMREKDTAGNPTGLEGDAFIDDYISKSIEETIAAAKAANPPPKNDGKKHKSHIVTDTNGIIQAGGN
jgi:hypothetical protein